MVTHIRRSLRVLTTCRKCLWDLELQSWAADHSLQML